MEELVSGAIVRSYFRKLEDNLSVDVAVVGAGPSGLLAACDLAAAGNRVVVFERRLAPGGGTWGGAMLFNEVVVQSDVCDILDEIGVRHEPCAEGYVTLGSVELASALILAACHAGVTILNGVSVEDIVFKQDRVGGVVVNWSPVTHLEMHVDPLVVTARAVLDGTGHPSEVSVLAARKAGVRLNTPDGGVMGERPMWMERGEAATVEGTGRICPGLYVSGMAANNVSGAFRMGPIFGGMLKSGRKAARLIAAELARKD
jgi:thiamine thiazole synthase